MVKERTIKGEYLIEGNIRDARPYQRGDIFIGSSPGGGGYGDVLERDPEAVIQDLENGFISEWVAKNVYKVVYDPETRILDEEATQKAREQEREARKRRGQPFDQFMEEWSKKRP